MEVKYVFEQRGLIGIRNVEIDPQRAFSGRSKAARSASSGRSALDLSVGAPVNAVWRGLWHGVRSIRFRCDGRRGICRRTCSAAGERSSRGRYAS